MNENIMIIKKSTFKLKMSKIALVVLSGFILSACNEAKQVETNNDKSFVNQTDQVRQFILKSAVSGLYSPGQILKAKCL